MKTTTPTIEAARARHHIALFSLCTPAVQAKSSPLNIWRKLRRLESEAHDAATAQCNGAAYRAQPFRPDWLADGSEGTEANPTPWERYSVTVYDRLERIMGKLPEGFRYNQDARGYALKINPDHGTIPDGLETDWGGNGILAAVIE